MTDLISVIITTYNWPAALAACLNSFANQTDGHFELIIADDGSRHDTHQLIADFSASTEIPVHHIYHEDIGFRAATIRNKAVAASHGVYLLFVDGDCVVLPHFIARHRQLAEQNFWVPGNRILASETFTQASLSLNLALHQQSCWYFCQQWLKGNINRLFPLIYFPFSFFRYFQPNHWQKAMTCNLGVWKADFIAVNGFDELFAGWGFEDSDLVIRLIHFGIKRKEGRFAVPVLHLWHRQNDRSQHDINLLRLQQRLDKPAFFYAEQGFDQYL